MFQRRGGLGLANKAGVGLSVEEFGMRRLDGHQALQPEVAGQIDVSHAPGTERLDDGVLAESCRAHVL